MTERRKNPNDPIAHPALFFRKSAEFPSYIINRDSTPQIDCLGNSESIQASFELAKSVYSKERLFLSNKVGMTMNSSKNILNQTNKAKKNSYQPYLFDECTAQVYLPIRPKTAMPQSKSAKSKVEEILKNSINQKGKLKEIYDKYLDP